MPTRRRWFEALMPWRTPQTLSGLEVLHLDGATLTAPLLPMAQLPPLDTEFGVAGTQNFGGVIKGEDANPDFDNVLRSIPIYTKMRQDAQVKAVLQVLKLPLLGATWSAQPPSNGDNVDQAIADFINTCLFEDDAMSDPWHSVLRHILLQLEYGFSSMETIWYVDDLGAYRLRRLAPRLPKTVREFIVSRKGELRGIVQFAPVLDDPPLTLDPQELYRQRLRQRAAYQYLVVPADYLAHFVLDREGDNYLGTSLLRPLYRNYFYKDLAYRTEAIRQDRWAAGIPVAEVQPGEGITAGEKKELIEILKGMRGNEKAYLISPPNVKFKILPEGSGGSARANISSWVDHHDSQMARSVLAGFLTMGRDTKGTLGYGSRLTDLFISSLQGVANGVTSDLKRQVVRKLCDLNFDMTRRPYPNVSVLDLDSTDVEGLVEVLAKLENVFVTPDDDIEKLLRKVLRLPALKPEDSREAKAAAAMAVPAPLADGTAALPEETPPVTDPSDQPFAPPVPGGAGRV